jgi:hypothetical protein
MGSKKETGTKLLERVLKLSGWFALGEHNTTTRILAGDQDVSWNQVPDVNKVL